MPWLPLCLRVGVFKDELEMETKIDNQYCSLFTICKNLHLFIFNLNYSASTVTSLGVHWPTRVGCRPNILKRVVLSFNLYQYAFKSLCIKFCGIIFVMCIDNCIKGMISVYILPDHKLHISGRTAQLDGDHSRYFVLVQRRSTRDPQGAPYIWYT